MPCSPFFPPRCLRHWYGLFAALVCALLFAAPAQADPPGRIGRIAWMSSPGAVDLYNPSTGESYSAPLNHPLTSGDILTTRSGARVEIQIGSMTVRLDSDTSMDFSRIDDEQVRLSLREGRTFVKLPSRDIARDFELDTPMGQFNARDAGIYRFDAGPNNAGATAYYGRLQFTGSDSALDIDAGQSAQFWNAGQTRYRLSVAINDDFTQWSAARDRRPVTNTYSRYVSPEMTGAEDLDAYGNWSENAEYGPIWYPRAVPAEWTPYRNGHWVWVAPWGWSWVAYEPWGFAPFHYGRWVQHRGAWGWVPGIRVARPAYSPAMVAWIGTPGIGVSFAFGTSPAVGWFPLAPREVYVPAYRSSAEYVRRINGTHVTNITNVTNIVNNPQDFMRQTHYAYRQHPRAVTFVPVDVVTHRRSVETAALPPRDQRALREQPVQAAAPVPAPRVETRNRQDDRERQDAASFRQERERRSPVVAAPSAPPAPVAAPQRIERAIPDNPRPALQAPARPEALESRAQERAPRRDETAVRQLPREPRSEVAPLAPVQRIERTLPDNPRPAPPSQLRSEPLESRAQDRAPRHDESAVRQAPRETRIEASPQALRPAPPVRLEPPAPIIRESRHEAPRDAGGPPGRPADVRPESRNQHQEALQRPDQTKQHAHEKPRQHREDEEKH